jgi:hypothetical protein
VPIALRQKVANTGFEDAKRQSAATFHKNHANHGNHVNPVKLTLGHREQTVVFTGLQD